ncbi:hypothetical protein H9L13_10480 [Sphingomonas lutea]|uniref:Uncharacterized protein n=1 Tax=Sphingomonas lutea TaxID=1045317 RepID=A0A7G9SGS7_9SPHN|nr:hypothetical protein [Sphingomonas lutea]QNN67052.1 hypothetical protein H9L13_10480 [Sphingomonas lutea]
MARQTTKTGGTTRKPAAAKTATRKPQAARSSGRSSGGSSSTAGDAFINLLQSPLVADLLAVAATAALAALAEHGFNKSGSGRQRTSKAVKEAGKAAAGAIGRRLSNEFDEIKKASNAKSQGGAKA